MSSIEIVAALLGLACVALGVRRNIWTYPTGIASVALFGAVFFDARLYSDALLQGFFVVANLYGWANWQRHRDAVGDVVVEGMTAGARLGWAAGCVAATIGWGGLMHRYTDASYPWADAGIAIVSVAAQILMARRKWENWVLWIGVDVASLPLYLTKGLWVTAVLYAVFLMLAVSGLVTWRRAQAA